jgi:hypothetical protein
MAALFAPNDDPRTISSRAGAGATMAKWSGESM